jgi:phosphoribosylanthranilate isomerase
VRIVLAGGLRADNVAEAIERISPDAVDVSSGVESSKGIKDERSMIRFIEEVQRGDAHRG